MKATTLYIYELSNIQIAKKAKKAFELIENIELSECLYDGKTLLKSILDGNDINYNDGYYIVEKDNFYLYVDITCKYIKECL